MAISRKVSTKGFTKQLTTTDLQGAIANPYAGVGGAGTITISTNTSLGLTPTSGKTYLVNTTSSAISITLPIAQVKDFILTVKDIGGLASTNNITIQRAGSENIEGLGANYVCAADYGSWTFQYDGAGNWWIL